MIRPRNPSLLAAGLAFHITFASLPAAADGRVPVVATRDLPVDARKLPDGRWFIDFGKATFGNLEISGAGLRAATEITVHLGENLEGPDRVHRRPGGTVRYQSHRLTLEPGDTASPALTWEPPGWMKDEWLLPTPEMGEVMPFRYVEIQGAPESFAAGNITRVSWAVPFDSEASDFSSSSPELGSVWDFCKHSIFATTFLGIYVDGDRERRPYEADILINQLSHYAVDASYDIARSSIEHIIRHPTWPTEWRLQTAILAWNDFLWSGDDSLLHEHYEVIKERAMIPRRTESGLFLGFIDGEIKDIVDWPAGERDNYDMSMPVKAVVTAFHHQALVLLEKIATHLGKTADAASFAGMAAATGEAFNREFWDEDRGCYIDGLDPATGAKSSHASAHANFFPLALGLVPADRVPRVAAYLKPKGMACSVYGAQFLLEALYDSGEAAHAFDLLTSDSLRSWRNMSEKLGSTITLEAWDPSLKPNLDWNHAWGAAPSNLIYRKLMGIEPLEHGFKRFRIRPRTAGLEQATLKAPTPKGPVHLRVTSSEEDWKAEVVVPPGTAAELWLPGNTPPALTGPEGPAKVRVLRTEGQQLVIGLLPGQWTLVQSATAP